MEEINEVPAGWYTWLHKETFEGGMYAEEHTRFAFEYLGFIRNRDYKTDRAVFEVKNRICNEEVISYFHRIRPDIAREGTAYKVKVRLWPLLAVIVKHGVPISEW